MSNGGHSSLMKAVREGKPGGPVMLSFDSLPRTWAGVALGIQYRAGNGMTSRRWVTVRSIDALDGTMWAYCWARRELRTFRLDRIKEAVDGDGQVVSGEEFLGLVGAAPSVAVTAPENKQGGFGQWAAGQRAERAEPESRAAKQLPIPVQIASGLGFAAVVMGILWLFF